MATFPLNAFTFTPNSDSVNKTETGVFDISGVVTAISNSLPVNTLGGNDNIDGTATSSGVTIRAEGIGILNSSTIEMGVGNDRITGTGTGLRTKVASENGFGVGVRNFQGTVDMGIGNDNIYGTALGTQFGVGIDNVRGTIEMGAGNDSFRGTGTGEGLNGFTPSSGTGIDNVGGTIEMGTGNDSIYGTGNGRSSGSASGINNVDGTIEMGAGNDSIYGIATVGTYDSVSIFNPDARGINNVNGTIEMGAGNDSIYGNSVVDRLPTSSNLSILNSFNSGTIDMGTGDDRLFFAASIVGVAQKVTIDGGGNIELGAGNDYFQGFGSQSVFGGSEQDTLDLSAFTLGVGGLGIVKNGGNSVDFTYNGITMQTHEFESFKIANNTYSYAGLPM